MKLRKEDAQGVDFLSETPSYFNVTGEHLFQGTPVISGNLENLKITVSPNGVNVKDGSLCKWYLGDNFKTMGRGDMQRAIEMLSDILHLPINKAIVTRIDIAQNFITQYQTDVYFNHLGMLSYATRLQEPTGIYYNLASGRLCFYDKIREQKNKGEPIPELYKNRNVLRYELRFTKRIAKYLAVPIVTGALLYNEALYIMLLDRWRDYYRAIQKINDVTLNFEKIKTRQELYKMGVLSILEQIGGQLKMLNQLSEAQKRGDLSKKQAFDLRQTINDACKIREGLTVPNDAIIELDKKIQEAVKFYR